MRTLLPAGQKPLPGQIVDWEAYCGARPVAAWWFNDPSGSPIVTDGVGRNTGTIIHYDSADWAPGSGLAFNDTADGMSIPNNTYCAGATTFFMTAYMTNAAGSSKCLYAERDTWPGYRFQCVWNTDTTIVYIGDANRSVTVPAYVRYSTYDIAIVNVPTGSYSAYINGVLVGSTSGTVPKANPVQTWRIGYNTDVAETLQGVVYKSFLWTAALTAAQVQALQGPIPLYDPRRYWYPAAAPVGGTIHPLIRTEPILGGTLINRGLVA